MPIRHDSGFLIFDIIPPPLQLPASKLCAHCSNLRRIAKISSLKHILPENLLSHCNQPVSEDRDVRSFVGMKGATASFEKTEEISVNVIRIVHTKGGHFGIKRTAKKPSTGFSQPKEIFVHRRPQIGPFECGRSCVTFQVSIGRDLNLINAAYGLLSKLEM